ncbi:uroporphyrinogen-III synthase [Candidatus Nitrosocosmicus sp. FF01]|uniref:uroporphyrinogen-III synthase n=1 Tax=Candidatus Nitrosocosmicus sp. FF01 TaxID=3397670 RepID=UPI0039ECD326
MITLPTMNFKKIYSKEVKDALAKISKSHYDHCIFLSSNSVDIFFEMIKDEHEYMEILHGLSTMKIIAIGPKTKYTLRKHGFKSQVADHHNNNYSMTGINKFLQELDSEIKERHQNNPLKILLPRSAQSVKSNNFINSTFENIELDQVFFYDTTEIKNASNSPVWKKLTKLSNCEGKSFLIFTSPSAVRSFFNIMYQLSPKFYDNRTEKDIIHDLRIYKVISIGPATSRALIERDIAYLESSTHTVKGTLELVFKLP